VSWPSVIFFDAGGTLLAPYPSVGHIYAEVAARHGELLDPEATDEAFTSAFAEVRARRLASQPHLFGFSPTDAWELWREVLGETFRRLGLDPDAFEPIFEALYEEFSLATSFRVLDGAHEVLDALRAQGFKTGLISNWDHRLRRILDGLDLTQRLDPIIISCEIRAEKPAGGIFAEALRMAGAAPDEALMVGDSPGPDIEGAQSAGLDAVLLDTSGWYAGEAPTIPSLRALPAWIESRRS